MDLIRTHHNVLSKEFCEKLIEIFEADKNKVPGKTLGGVNLDVKKTFDLHLSTCTDLEGIVEYDKILFEKINYHVDKYINEYINSDSLTQYSDEGFQIQKYIKNTGFYKYHCDELIKTRDKKSRMVTYIFYLNTVDEGGETEIDIMGTKHKIKAEQGKLLLFPASWCYPHSGLMPLSHDKYIATGWFYLHA